MKRKPRFGDILADHRDKEILMFIGEVWDGVFEGLVLLSASGLSYGGLSSVRDSSLIDDEEGRCYYTIEYVDE